MSPGISTRLLATQSDERLLALVRDGHERAFEVRPRAHRYRKPLLNYCRRLPIPDARAEDILQQALLKAWIALRSDSEVRDLKAWLYRVVHNAALNAARDAAYDRERLTDPTLQVGASHGDVERGLMFREALAEVAALPHLQREVMVRTAVGGDSHEQVASDLGITDGAVRGLLYRARATLRTATTALTPPPLLSWLVGRADQGGGSAPERLSELAAGGGTAGLGGLIVKGGVAAVTAGTLLTGAVVHIQSAAHPRAPVKVAAAAPAGADSSQHTPTVAVTVSLARRRSPAPRSGATRARELGTRGPQPASARVARRRDGRRRTGSPRSPRAHPSGLHARFAHGAECDCAGRLRPGHRFHAVRGRAVESERSHRAQRGSGRLAEWRRGVGRRWRQRIGWLKRRRCGRRRPRRGRIGRHRHERRRRRRHRYPDSHRLLGILGKRLVG